VEAGALPAAALSMIADNPFPILVSNPAEKGDPS
jgi:hypothetical protein